MFITRKGIYFLLLEIDEFSFRKSFQVYDEVSALHEALIGLSGCLLEGVLVHYFNSLSISIQVVHK